MTSNFSPTRLVHQSDEGRPLLRTLFLGVSCLVDGMMRRKDEWMMDDGFKIGWMT